MIELENPVLEVATAKEATETDEKSTKRRRKTTNKETANVQPAGPTGTDKALEKPVLQKA